jgi:3-oxoacyl-ACP reductase-like protein
MGVFSSIMDKIFHHPAAAQAAPQAQPQPAVATAAQPAAQSAAQSAAPASSLPQVDVEGVLVTMAEFKGDGGNWRTSIVDLLKLLDLDSGLQARKQLAEELGVHAGADGSAEENVALHQAVMQKLADNGGLVPDSLRAV